MSVISALLVMVELPAMVRTMDGSDKLSKSSRKCNKSCTRQ